ncbi:Oidioi.mRNA.OKI2018_I69.chr2.g8274.t1.cds [Oikopleura dioica]|uniref:Phosphorylase b kinase regulatory subunit n=1 Tax=Oikopleura dioica TaxID=34765 RepID=A0ABN7TB03_OIKDI|nr:Oidioi.mRNA.OKI2018_I69.chr2.g8274.t1.cds [Oikopleura dioica]
MTSSELKFALLVENTLNGIPEPERRQMVVEALSVLSMLASFQTKVNVEWIIDVDVILSLAEQFFREDQILEGIQSDVSHEDFYDSAPTGRFGTMAYLVRACTDILEKEAEQGESKHCAVQ